MDEHNTCTASVAMVADSRIQDQCHTAEKQISKRKCPENTEIVWKQENDKIPCDGKKMMDQAGAPNDC